MLVEQNSGNFQKIQNRFIIPLCIEIRTSTAAVKCMLKLTESFEDYQMNYYIFLMFTIKLSLDVRINYRMILTRQFDRVWYTKFTLNAMIT